VVVPPHPSPTSPFPAVDTVVAVRVVQGGAYLLRQDGVRPSGPRRAFPDDAVLPRRDVGVEEFGNRACIGYPDPRLGGRAALGRLTPSAVVPRAVSFS